MKSFIFHAMKNKAAWDFTFRMFVLLLWRKWSFCSWHAIHAWWRKTSILDMAP